MQGAEPKSPHAEDILLTRSLNAVLLCSASRDQPSSKTQGKAHLGLHLLWASAGIMSQSAKLVVLGVSKCAKLERCEFKQSAGGGKHSEKGGCLKTQCGSCPGSPQSSAALNTVGYSSWIFFQQSEHPPQGAEPGL